MNHFALRALGVVVLLLVAHVILVETKAVAAEGDDGGLGVVTDSSDDDFFIELSREEREIIGTSGGSGDSGDTPPFEIVRAPACVSAQYRMDVQPVCIHNDPMVVECIDGSTAQDPLWIRTEQSPGVWSDWSVLRWHVCPNDAPLLAAIQREWSQLEPQPSTIALQPNTGWVYAAVPTVAVADDAPRIHTTMLLGAYVEIRATPSEYLWAWGDGTTTATDDPGRPYPNATITHTYDYGTTSANVRLSTTWTGQFRINGGVWQAFESELTTASAPQNLTIHNPRSRLVGCDTDGECRTEASAAGP